VPLRQRVKWIHRASLSLAALAVLAPFRFVYAGEPADQPIAAQYSVTAWGHKDGLPSAFLYAITQTPDGFLWLGTADGLVRFDGVQFARWRPAQLSGQPLGQVRALNVARSGDLLLGTGAGLLGRMRNGELQVANLHSTVESIQESRDGSLWVATSAALWHLDEASLQGVEPPILMLKEWLSGPVQDRGGREWISTQEGVFFVDAHSMVRANDRPARLFVTQDGYLALFDGRGYIHLLQNRDAVKASGRPLPHSSTVIAVTTDSNGTLWIATHGDGVTRMATAGGQTSVEQFTRNDGLSSNFVRSVFEDREHNIWLATENGLDRLRRNNVLSLTRRDGLLSDTVTSIGAGKDGSVWLATPDGLECLHDGEHSAYLKGVGVLSLVIRDNEVWAGTTRGLMQWSEGQIFSAKNDAQFPAVTALAEDAAGTLWFYDGGNGVFRQQPGHAPAAVTDGSLLHEDVTAIASDPGGDVWFGLASGNLVEYRKGEFHTYSKQDGLSGGAIHGLSAEPGGGLWAATERGLCLFMDGHFACQNERSGLSGDRVLWAVPDAEGNIWLGYSIGVARVNAQQLRDAANTGSSKLKWKLFDDGDGIENSPNIRGNAPAVVAPDGRLWMTTSQGVAVLDPGQLRTNPLPPPVRILALEADGRDTDLSGRVRLPPLTRSVQFSFTGLSLSDPRKVRFRYRLDGFDREWHDGGARRDAFYTNLPPGAYTFRVNAANNDGVWNNTGATLNFLLAPAYFQTAWFRLLCVAAALLGIALVFGARLRSVKRNMRMRYEERIEERTRIAQELHDHLIQEMVGISMQLEVADELTPGGAGAKSPLERALAFSQSAIASGRLTLEALRSRPITASAFMETLRRTAEAYPERDGMAVEYLVEGDERLLRPEIGDDLSELGQEALRNALKHAGNVAIHVRLIYTPASVELRVHDNGGGITNAILQSGVRGHYGLAGMRERAARISARFSINSAPGQGTTVLVSVPASRAYQEVPGSGSAGPFSLFLRRVFRQQEKAK
jgi:signal transduction histidine kinase/ligand-binding sensor domain-containing protein